MLKVVKVFKHNQEAKLPARNIETDAGIDLFAAEGMFISVGETKLIKTGIAVEIPKGYVGKIEGRSSMNLSGVITAGGVIDTGFSGDFSVVLHNFSNKTDPAPHAFAYGKNVFKGDKIAQLLIYKVETPKVKEVKKLWKSKRGQRGFGSSGR